MRPVAIAVDCSGSMEDYRQTALALLTKLLQVPKECLPTVYYYSSNIYEMPPRRLSAEAHYGMDVVHNDMFKGHGGGTALKTLLDRLTGYRISILTDEADCLSPQGLSKDDYPTSFIQTLNLTMLGPPDSWDVDLLRRTVYGEDLPVEQLAAEEAQASDRSPITAPKSTSCPSAVIAATGDVAKILAGLNKDEARKVLRAVEELLDLKKHTRGNG